MSLRGKNSTRFINTLLQTFVTTYLLRIPGGCLKDMIQNYSCRKSYPDSNLHKIKTEDGCFISCRQWECTQKPCGIRNEKKLHLVLLLNGYSTESYALPTEPHDVVRTLLEEGHEIWLLQPRLHPLNPADNVTIDDIGKYDILAAINKILELHGLTTEIHIIAHCVGGLAIHIALMGGHLNASNIASLTCMNLLIYLESKCGFLLFL
ncbi:hypothetical protein M5689_015590 [Euphorbia peplus]|nr:hypothetical protein M5689_015590 [Euphorbia peplus]